MSEKETLGKKVLIIIFTIFAILIILAAVVKIYNALFVSFSILNLVWGVVFLSMGLGFFFGKDNK